MSNISLCNLLYTEHKSVIIDFITKCYVNKKYLNVVFICKDNEYVEVHQNIIISVSNYLKRIIRNSGSEVVFISLPDIESSAIKILVNFLYEGVAKVNREELRYIEDLLIFLDIRLSNCEIEVCTTVPGETAVNVNVDSIAPAPFAAENAHELPQCSQQENIILQGVSDVASQESPTPFNNNEDSCSIDYTEEVYYISSDEEANDSNGMAMEGEIDMNYPSSRNMCVDTLQEKGDMYFENTSSVAERESLRQKEFFSKEQTLVLEEAYAKNKYLNEELREKLVVTLGISRYRLANWFGYRRYKDQFDHKKRNIKRKTLNEEQSSKLKEVYGETKYLNEEHTERLANSLGISTFTVKRWFKNKRYKDGIRLSTYDPSKELHSSFTNIEESQFIHNSEVLESNTSNKTSNIPSEMVLNGEDVDADDLSLQQTEKYTFQENERDSDVVSESSTNAAQQEEGSSLTNNKESQCIDNPEVSKSKTYPEEHDILNQMIKEEEVDIEHISSETVYVDALHPQEISLSENRNTLEDVSEADNVLLNDGPVNTVVSPNPQKVNQEDDASNIAMSEAVHGNDVITVSDNVQENNLMEQTNSIMEINLVSVPKSHQSPGIAGVVGNQTVSVDDDYVSSTVSYNPEKRKQENNTSGIGISKVQISNQHKDDSHDYDDENENDKDDDDDNVIVISDDDEEICMKEESVYNMNTHPPPTVWNNADEPFVAGQQYMNLEGHVVSKLYSLSAEQKSMLENVFKETNYLNRELVTELVTSVRISEHALKRWFCKKREKEKRKLDRLQRNSKGCKKPYLLSKEQKSEVEKVFKRTKYLNDKLKAKLTATTGVPGKALIRWFSRKREREKRKLGRLSSVQCKGIMRQSLSKEQRLTLETVYMERKDLNEELYVELTENLKISRDTLRQWFMMRQFHDQLYEDPNVPSADKPMGNMFRESENVMLKTETSVINPSAGSSLMQEML